MKKTFLTISLLVMSAVSMWAQEYDPSFFVYLGAMFHAPRTDYVSDFGGLNAGFSFSLESGHAFLLDASLGGGVAKRDFKTSEGMILDNDDLTHVQLFLDYGHIVYQTGRVQVFPFAGLGVMGYQFEYDEDREIYFDKSAFSANIGLCYDINLKERPNWFRQTLRIKPSASVSFYNGPLHVVPSFNLSVVYCMGM